MGKYLERKVKCYDVKLKYDGKMFSKEGKMEECK